MSSNPGQAQQSLTTEQIVEALEEHESEDLIDKRPHDDVLETHLRGKSHRQRTIDSKRRTWDQFTDYFDESENEFLSDIDANDIGQFKKYLKETSDMSPYTRLKHLERLKQVLDTCVNSMWVTSDLGDWDEHYPDIPAEDRQRDEDDVLTTERGNEILAWVEEERYAQREHVLWILIWKLGLRKGACLALDRKHFHDKYDDCECGNEQHPVEGHHLVLRNRPEIDLGLKKCGDIEPEDRYLPLAPEDGRAIRRHLMTNPESDESDEYGNYGLLGSQRSARLSGSGFYRAVCKITSPATYENHCECGYCRDRDDNDNLTKRDAHKCEESRSPHGCRHGAITRFINRVNKEEELTLMDVSYMVGTDPATLKRVYDRSTKSERFNRHVSGLRSTL